MALITVHTGGYRKKVRWTLILYDKVVGNILKNMPTQFIVIDDIFLGFYDMLYKRRTKIIFIFYT